MAGRICTSVSLQLVKRSFTPWKSIANAPTNIARGANQRLRWLSASTVLSTIASSPVRMAPTRRPNCVPIATLRDGGDGSSPTSSPAPGALCRFMTVELSGAGRSGAHHDTRDLAGPGGDQLQQPEVHRQHDDDDQE